MRNFKLEKYTHVRSNSFIVYDVNKTISEFDVNKQGKVRFELTVKMRDFKDKMQEFT